MGWTGTAPNQTFQRTDGTRTGSQTWQQADAASVDIIATDHDTHDQDIAAGISGTLKKDGGNAATADLPMGGFRHTNVGDAASLASYPSLQQYINAAGQYAPTVGGSGNAITLTTGFSVTAYAAGQTFSFIVGASNTGATTVNVDAIGIVSIVRADGSNTALSAGDLIAGAVVEIQYDGTRFHLRSTSLASASADIYARITPAGAVMAWPHTTLPGGWLECDGSAFSRSGNPELFANIGTTFGVGDGSTTANLPDFRGEFLRGFDLGATVDVDATLRTDRGDGTGGNVVGAKQADSLKDHTHGLTMDAVPDHTHDFDYNGTGSISGASGVPFVRAITGAQIKTTDSGGGHTPTGTVGDTGDNETRGVNSAVKWIILANPAAAAAGTVGINGLQYNWSTATLGDPGTGAALVNNATLASATIISLHKTDTLGSDISGWLATWDNSTSTVKGHVHISKVGAPGDYVIYSITGSITDQGDYDDFTIAHVDSNGTFASGDNINVMFYRTGDRGTQGIQGASGLNVLINGAMRIAQRGSSFDGTTSPANNDDTYTLDRWILLSDGNDIVDVSQDSSDVPGDGQYACKLDVETASKKFGICQIIESKNIGGILDGSVTLSFEAKVSANGAGRLDNIKAVVLAWTGTADAVTSDVVSTWNAEDTTPTFAAGFVSENTPLNLSVTASYATISLTATLDQASTNNLAVFVWADGLTGTVGDTLHITNVKFERGAVATALDHRSYAAEMDLCQRYYCKSMRDSIVPADGVAYQTDGFLSYGAATNSTTLYCPFVEFPSRMRSTPTMTFYRTTLGVSAGRWAYLTGGWASFTAEAALTTSELGFSIFATGAGFTQNYTYGLAGAWVAEAEL